MKRGRQFFVISFISLLSLFFVTNVAEAQGIDFSSGSKPQGPLLSQSTSPNDFKNRVRSLGKQNQEELSKQIKQELSQQPKPNMGGAQPSIPNAQPKDAIPSPPPGTPILSEPQNVVLPAPTFSPSAPGASPPASAPTQTPPSQNNQGIYTGFGEGAGSPPPPPNQAPEGGWNIKY